MSHDVSYTPHDVSSRHQMCFTTNDFLLQMSKPNIANTTILVAMGNEFTDIDVEQYRALTES